MFMLHHLAVLHIEVADSPNAEVAKHCHCHAVWKTPRCIYFHVLIEVAGETVVAVPRRVHKVLEVG